jgi:23S rRNA (cytidine1920-2'-O)/16S rRNA (cytidine1409-2'-O)-methyltransferase
MTVTRQRLDTLLAERGLFPSRSRAAASVMAGEVSLGPERRRAAKPGEMVKGDVEVAVRQAPAYVSRGGVKLANALTASGLDVAGRRALDVGASTGGFTDCLLQRGASAVVAVDVGYGDLDYGLRTDPRVTALERTNARSLTPQMLPFDVDLAMIDVSFISVAKVLPAVLGCLPKGLGAPPGETDAPPGEADTLPGSDDRPARHDAMAMVKPQFEVGREKVGKGGVVRSAEDRRQALVEVALAAIALGEGVLGMYSSRLPGPKGNIETFLWLTEPGREGASTEQAAIERMALEVEPPEGRP